MHEEKQLNVFQMSEDAKSKQHAKTQDKRYHAETTKSNYYRNDDESSSLYEQWRANPHINVTAQKNIENTSFRSTYNHLFKQKSQPVNDSLLSQNMMSKKTYFTSLKEHI